MWRVAVLLLFSGDWVMVMGRDTGEREGNWFTYHPVFVRRPRPRDLRGRFGRVAALLSALFIAPRSNDEGMAMGLGLSLS